MSEESQNTEQLRAQAAFLLSQAQQQSCDIQQALGAASDSGALHSRLAAAAAQISGAMSALSQALASSSFPLRASDLTALESVVHSDETSTLLAEATAQAAAATTSAQNLATASVAAQKYINDQLARRTPDGKPDPEGTLNASGGTIGAMLDANAHGAGDSPDFMPRWNALVDKAQRLRAAVQASGQSTEEFDRNLTASVRRFLKAKGLSDAEIDQRLSASANPLDAVKPFLKDDKDSRDLEEKVQLSRHIESAATPQPLAQVETNAGTPAPDAPLTINPDAMNAKLQALGLQSSDNANANVTGHGLAVAKPAGKDGQSIAG